MARRSSRLSAGFGRLWSLLFFSGLRGYANLPSRCDAELAFNDNLFVGFDALCDDYQFTLTLAELYRPLFSR